MPKRKRLPKLPDYTGLSSDEKMLVQKTNPLQSLSETDMTLPEFKILDAYLSRIDSHNPDKRYIRFEKGELEKALGVSRILKSDLEKRLDNLFTAVTLRDPAKPKGFVKIGLFAKAEANQDENGLWQIDLACTSEAMDYIFNPENIGYLKYRLKNVIDLTSRYSYVLYLYLEKNRWRKSWKISINELKAMLNCTAERYTQYKFFNSEILRKCHVEINEKTSLHYNYEPCDKKGRKYTAIKFTLETVSDRLDLSSNHTDRLPEPQLEGQTTLFDVDVVSTSERPAELSSGVLSGFDVNEAKLLRSLAEDVCKHGGNVDEYIKRKIEITDLYDSKHGVTSRFGYMRKLMTEDIKEINKMETSEAQETSYDLSDWERRAAAFDPTTLIKETFGEDEDASI